MKKIYLVCLLAVCLAPYVRAQNIVSVEPQDVTLAFLLQLGGIPATYNAENYKVVYTTTDLEGRLDTASGMLSLPQNASLNSPITIYMHGTVTDREAVPSRTGVFERNLVAALAANGYIGIAPDYLGLGDNEGFHPYVHAASEASAGRDMILAIQEYFAQNPDLPVQPNGQLFVTGYSQGGHAAQALHRDIQENPGDGLEVTAGTHLSGPYSISDVMRETVFADSLVTSPGFFAYTYVAYNVIYDLFDDYSEVFREPYVGIVDSFALGLLDIATFDTSLAFLLEQTDETLPEIFTDSIRTQLRTNDGDAPIVQALRDNDTYDWAPESPTLIVYCTEDDRVPFANSILADSVMRANGSTTVETFNGGALDHGGCVLPAAIATLDFFNRFADILSSTGGPIALDGFSISPNPVRAGQDLRLTGLPTGRFPYQLYAPDGRLLSNGQISGDRLPIPPTQPGLHVLRINLDGGNFAVRKLLVR